MKTHKILGILGLSLLLNSCGTVPITGRKRLSLVGDSEVLAMSQTQYRDFVTQARVQGVLKQDSRVMDISYRLIRATDAYLRAQDQANLLKGMSWEVNVVESNQVNAFCMPGGKIVVYTGLVRMLGNSPGADAELAAVLAHEISHALAKHSSERLSRAMASDMVGSLIGSIIGAKSPVLSEVFNLAYGLGQQGFVALPFARKQEYEADRMGLTLMSLAGFDPRAAVTLWQKMERNSGGSNKSEFFSTHPSEGNRIHAIEEALPDVMPLYNQATKSGSLSKPSSGKQSGQPFRYEGVSSRNR